MALSNGRDWFDDYLNESDEIQIDEYDITAAKGWLSA
jgi:hypothetical protein